MKRLLIATAVVALAFAGLAPTADAHSPTPPVGAGVCHGTAEWLDATSADGTPTTVWRFESDWTEVVIPNVPHCVGVNAHYPIDGVPGLPPPRPDLRWATLSATGSLECGNGTLHSVPEGPPYHLTGSTFGGPVATYNLDWTADFEDGVGTLTGTGVDRYNTINQHDQSPPIDVSGTIVLQGALDGSCNDTPDSPPTNVIVHLEWEPQS